MEIEVPVYMIPEDEIMCDNDVCRMKRKCIRHIAEPNDNQEYKTFNSQIIVDTKKYIDGYCGNFLFPSMIFFRGTKKIKIVE